MKKIILPFLILITVITINVSCKKALETVKAIFPEKTFDLPEVQDTLPPLDSIRLAGFPVTALPLDTALVPFRIIQPINMDSIVKANTGNNFGAGDITSLKVKQLKLKIIAGADAANNFSNFKSAGFNFSSNSNTNPVLVTTVSFEDIYSVDKTVSGDGTPELRPYLDGTQLYYDVTTTLRRRTYKPLKISIIATLTMK